MAHTPLGKLIVLNREIEGALFPWASAPAWNQRRDGVRVGPSVRRSGAHRSGANRPSFARWTSIERNWDLLEQLEAFASERGHTVTDLAIAWLVSRPYISTIIAGADVAPHVEANLQAAEWKLSPEELAELDHITQ